MRGSHRALLGVLVGVAAWGQQARADLRDECASASERAQQLRSRGKLVEARAQLLECSRQACPTVVKGDCEHILSEVEASLPSIAVSAKDPDGNDAVAVRVLVDGAPVREKLDGMGITLNPGEHDLRFELAGAKPASMHILVAEAQKDRIISVVFESLAPKPRPPTQEGSPPPVAPSLRQDASPLAYVLATLGGASLGAFAFFQTRAVIDSNHLRGTCAPRCPQSDVDNVSDDVVAAHVTLVGALVAGAAATSLFVFAPWPAHSGAAVAVGPGSVGVRVAF